jgi:DNA-binding LytR/AlgR family response regulator
VKIPLADILYIEGLADYLKIYIKDRKTIVARMPMKDMMEKLPSADFIRVHRSFILPFSKIEAVRGTNIFIGEKEFPIGRTYTDEFFERYSS